MNVRYGAALAAPHTLNIQAQTQRHESKQRHSQKFPSPVRLASPWKQRRRPSRNKRRLRRPRQIKCARPRRGRCALLREPHHFGLGLVVSQTAVVSKLQVQRCFQDGNRPSCQIFGPFAARDKVEEHRPFFGSFQRLCNRPTNCRARPP